MFSFLMQFIKIVYPVLKESLLGKQSLLEAIKTSKIKVLVLGYCLLSPVVIGYAFNKTVSLATTNIALSKKISELNLAVAQIATSGVKPSAVSTLPVKVTVSPPSLPMVTHKLRRKHVIPVSQDFTDPEDTHSHNLEEILNRNHEYN